MEHSEKLRIYKHPAECAVFCKTKEVYGGNSNMAAGFPLVVNDINIKTSEALYQALRFPHMSWLQEKIIAQCSPMSAKMVGKPYRDQSREDFDLNRVKFMRWAIRVKLLQNWDAFCRVLLETGDKPIIELSTKHDDFWGAVIVKEFSPPKGGRKQTNVKYLPSDEMPVGSLVGYNVMGRLTQELRENVKTGIDQMSENFTILRPLEVENFLLLGQPIREIIRR